MMVRGCGSGSDSGGMGGVDGKDELASLSESQLIGDVNMQKVRSRECCKWFDGSVI